MAQCPHHFLRFPYAIILIPLRSYLEFGGMVRGTQSRNRKWQKLGQHFLQLRLLRESQPGEHPVQKSLLCCPICRTRLCHLSRLETLLGPRLPKVAITKLLERNANILKLPSSLSIVNWNRPIW